MCCALISYVLSNVYMLQSEVNWFVSVSCIQHSHAAQSDSDTEGKAFSEMVPQWFGDETKEAVLLVLSNVSTRISVRVHSFWQP